MLEVLFTGILLYTDLEQVFCMKVSSLLVSTILLYRFTYVWSDMQLDKIIIHTSGKNHFHEMNGDVGMAGWK